MTTNSPHPAARPPDFMRVVGPWCEWPRRTPTLVKDPEYKRVAPAGDLDPTAAPHDLTRPSEGLGQ